MKQNYDYALRQVLVWETGFNHEASSSEDFMRVAITAHKTGLVNHPKDPGGLTNFGITQKTYTAWRKVHNQKSQEVTFITPQEVSAIYEQEYAKRVHFDELPSGVDYSLFDFAVNSGVKNAVKELQKGLGVTPDGILGVKTLAVIQNKPTDVLIRLIHQQRMSFLKRIPTWPTFGNGWTRRVNAVKEAATALWKNDLIETPSPDSRGAVKASGGLSVKGSIETSRRSKAALAGGAVGIMGVIPEVVETVRPLRESLEGLRYAALVSFIIMIVLFGYIIWIRTKHD